MSFQTPIYLLLLLLVPLLIWWYRRRLPGRETVFKLSSLRFFEQMPEGRRVRWRHLPFVLRILALTMAVIVLARPQTNDAASRNSYGIDIMIAMDISGSMLAEDLKPNRLQAAKKVAVDFIGECPKDNIGLVLYAGESFTQCPLTLDHSVLVSLFNAVNFGMLKDGTAIGLGLTNAVSRIKDSPGKSKVIILLTDGTNNAGDVSPQTAAEIAAQMGVRVYTVGVGTRGTAPFPVKDADGKIVYKDMAVDIDEAVLQTIAQTTGGVYFRATDNENLKNIYHEIDRLEKSKIEGREYGRKNDIYIVFALLALIFIFGEIILRNTVFRKIP